MNCGSILVWVIYTEKIPGDAREKPFVSFCKPGCDRECSFQISKAQQINSGGCWRFFPVVKGENLSSGRPFLFVLTDKVRYRSWPLDILTPSLVNAFLVDNKILSL